LRLILFPFVYAHEGDFLSCSLISVLHKLIGRICAGGYLAGSLAVATDAAHLLSDFAGFMISIFALYIAERPATKRLSYGYHRAGNFLCISSTLQTEKSNLQRCGIRLKILFFNGIVRSNWGLDIRALDLGCNGDSRLYGHPTTCG